MKTLKPIPNYEKQYLISKDGDIYSIRRKKFLRHRISKFGYARVILKVNKVSKHYFVHRLVAETYIPNPHNLPQINHKDENKLNNNVNNLEWCTSSYNINYGSRNAKLSAKSKTVYQYDENHNLIASYKSCMEASKITGFDFSYLYASCRNKTKSYGYFWSYS